MLRKILFISLALLSIGGAISFTIFSKPVLASQFTIDETVQAQILQATVRISLFAPVTDEQGNPQTVTVNGQQASQITVGEGLGTVTHQGEEVVIVTHDHWSLLTPDLQRVQFHNAANELLLEVSGEQFYQLIRYQDGGTMVLTAPDALVSCLTAVPLGNSNIVGRHDMVYLTYRQPHSGEISVAVMLVKKETTYKGQPVFRLISLNNEYVVDGNSGGGVLFNGKLIGNMWGTILEQELSRTISEGSNPLMQTSFSLMAQLPLSIMTQ